MSRQINQPINQVRLTNVAVVRMNRGGKRFEIACYRNKVVDYRQGLETDLSEVLQTERVFTNVSKGEFAKAKDLQKIFGTEDEHDIARMILSKGQVQVSDKERNQQLEKTNAQIAEWISKNCVQPNTDRPYTISQIRHAMQQANFSVHPTKPLKRQYLDCVKMLQSVIPIQRAKMELLLLIPDNDESSNLVEKTMQDNHIEWIMETEKTRSYKIKVDPSLYRILNEVVQDIAGANIEIVHQVVTAKGDTNLESDLHWQPEMLEGAEEPGTTTLPPTGHQVTTAFSDHDESESSDENAEGVGLDSRRQQTKKKKKNRKAQRREDTTGKSPWDVADFSAALPSNNERKASRASAPNQVPPVGSAASTSDSRKSCNTCGGGFDSATAYRAHFKSDWHRFNQKLTLNGAAPISEEEFKLVDSDSFFRGISDDSIL
jgi:ribosome maturation protein SDO1